MMTSRVYNRAATKAEARTSVAVTTANTLGPRLGMSTDDGAEVVDMAAMFLFSKTVKSGSFLSIGCLRYKQSIMGGLPSSSKAVRIQSPLHFSTRSLSGYFKVRRRLRHLVPLTREAMDVK